MQTENYWIQKLQRNLTESAFFLDLLWEQEPGFTAILNQQIIS